VAAAAVLVLAAGCAVPEPGRGDGAVLLADQRRGMGPASDLYDAPDFVLYTDGRAIVTEQSDGEVPRLVEYHLTRDRVVALFEEADDAGLFDDADYALDEQVPDAGSLVIVLRTAEREHVAKIVLPDPEDSGARGDAAAFAGSLRPADWAAGDFTEPSAPYRPGQVAVVYEVVTCRHVRERGAAAVAAVRAGHDRAGLCRAHRCGRDACAGTRRDRAAECPVAARRDHLPREGAAAAARPPSTASTGR
jgi:hypothetical protein